MNVKWLLSLFLLLGGAVSLSCVLAKMDIYMTGIECLSYEPKIVRSLSCEINTTASKAGLLNAEISLFEDVTNAEGLLIITMKRGSYSTNFTTMNLNVCTLMSSVNSQFFLKMAMSEIRRVGNFPLECPFKMNKRYYLNGFTVYSKYLPIYLPEMIFDSDILLNLNNRKSARITITGQIVRRD